MATRDARIERTRSKASQTVRQLLLSKGLAGVSHTEVARSSGISRATLYRHWPGVMDLVLLGLEDFQLSIDFPQGTSLKHDLAAGSRNAAQQLSGEAGAVLRHLWGVDEHEGFHADRLFSNAVGKLEACYQYHYPKRALVQPAVTLALSMLAGPVFLRWLLKLEPMTEDEYILLARQVEEFLNNASLGI